MPALIQRHPFHLVDPSPWPFLAAVSALTTTSGFVMYMHCYLGGFYLGFIGFLSLVNVSFFGGEILLEKELFRVIIQKRFNLDYVGACFYSYYQRLCFFLPSFGLFLLLVYHHH